MTPDLPIPDLFYEIVNHKRKHRPWWELSELILQYHTKKIAEHGQAKTGRPYVTKLGWSLRETARSIAFSVSAVSKHLNLARAMRENAIQAETLRRLKFEDAFNMIKKDRGDDQTKA